MFPPLVEPLVTKSDDSFYLELLYQFSSLTSVSLQLFCNELWEKVFPAVNGGPRLSYEGFGSLDVSSQSPASLLVQFVLNLCVVTILYQQGGKSEQGATLACVHVP